MPRHPEAGGFELTEIWIEEKSWAEKKWEPQEHVEQRWKPSQRVEAFGAPEAPARVGQIVVDDHEQDLRRLADS